MSLEQALKTPGEHKLLLSGEVGQLEACLNVPENKSERYIALLGHPHSLQGGTMNNKVVTTLVRAFKDLGIPSLRFNFRGVGQSHGEYDAGVGESEDMCLLAEQCQEFLPEAELLFAGFSFGSYVAYRAAALLANRLLITIAPPVHHYDYNLFTPRPNPWVIVQGDLDDVAPLSLVQDFAEHEKLSLIRLPEAEHFFHGQLLNLKDILTDVIGREIYA